MSTAKTELEISLEAQIEAVKKKRNAIQSTADALSIDLVNLRRKLRDEWNRKSNIEIDRLKYLLADRYSISQDSERFKKIFSIAWDRGHSGGLQDVSSAFDEMADLL